MAGENPNSVQATEQQIASANPPVAATALFGDRSAYRDLKVELTDSDLATTGTQKLILHNYYRSEDRCAEQKAELQRITPLYYEADKKRAILDEKLLAFKSNDFLFTAMVGIGGAVLGASTAFHEISGYLTALVFVFGLAIIGAVIYSKKMLK